MKIKCSHCGKEFDRKPSETGLYNNYCSKSCHLIAVASNKKLNGMYSGGQYVNCVICGTKHYRTPSQFKKANGHPCCCRECFGMWQSKNLVGKAASNYKGINPPKKCPVCGNTFQPTNRKVKYCSLQCKNAFSKKQKTATCCQCGKLFSRPESYFFWHEQRGHKRTFCSKACQTKYFSGKNSPAWIADRTKLKSRNKSIRASAAMRHWRESVFKRDSWTCRICGARSHKGVSVQINAHHIWAFKDRKDLRFEISNGITLCSHCHNNVHNKPGIAIEKILQTYTTATRAG